MSKVTYNNAAGTAHKMSKTVQRKTAGSLTIHMCTALQDRLASNTYVSIALEAQNYSTQMCLPHLK